MRDIRIYGDPVLRKQGKAVEQFDESLQKIVEEMIETMRVADGVGLAAPQIGESMQLAVIDATGGEKPPLVLINPEIIAKSDEMEVTEEGCLSLPDIHVKVKRPVRVTVKAVNEKNESFVIESAEGLLARALQHEIDHLNGIMIVDHISMLQRQLLKSKLKELQKLNSAQQ